MAILTAEVKIRGTRPMIFNNFSIDRIPLKKAAKSGVAGNNPEEWKQTFETTPEGQLYVNSSYIFSCLRAGGKFLPKSRGTMEGDVAATLQVQNEKILFNRFIESLDNITTNKEELIYIDIRPVARRGVKNIRYRLATKEGWETEFKIAWDNHLISHQQMHAICNEAGSFAGLGDARKIGYGRFDVVYFNVLKDAKVNYA